MLERIDVLTLTRIISSLCREFGPQFPMPKSSLGKKVEKYDQEKMILPEKQDEYKMNLKEHLQELVTYPDDNLDSRWNKITGVIHKTAEETFGKASKKTTK